ncbi:ATP-binding region ATPase domain protein [Desulfovibrio sp. X2]|uniref:sensor histidine kinase n=1 Tax=Desulfovibrio sp. X2 TaxID=941449 RepID=UPI000358EFB1|nr:HAMP domain-containing sensor histidine kinase [Desulfovibrio sp. X2]EPR43608.1 ATP-binding region ATPase domain protein [Desulfovibrio sp. X2]
MNNAVIPFLPSDRLPPETVRQQAEAINSSQVREVLDNLPHIIFILNSFRQIVFFNKMFLELAADLAADLAAELAGGLAAEKLLGLRPGEALSCQQVPSAPGGCGTGRNCRHCGAAQAIFESLAGREARRECRLTRHAPAGFQSLDLLVYTKPVNIGGENFIIFSVQDISDEKRRQALEHIFFHDILNTATGLRGLIQFLSEEVPPALREEAGLLAGYFEQMVEEILAQKDLLDAENDRLEVSPEEMDPEAFLSALLPIYRTHPLARNHRVALGAVCPAPLASDPILVKRVLDNMVKNALEAEDSGGTVTLSCSADPQRVHFHVHNPATIPDSVRPFVFQRSFSTKGRNRGLGTYGMRLLAERYLGGEVSFESSPPAGTTFTLSLPRRPAPIPNKG